MRRFFQMVSLGCLCWTFPLYLCGEGSPAGTGKSLAERSPFGNKPKPPVKIEPPKPALRPIPKTLEFRGMVKMKDGRVFCVLFDKAKSRGASVPLRDASAEYFIERYDERAQSITVRTSHGPQVLQLQDAPNATGGYSSYSGGGDYGGPQNPFESPSEAPSSSSGEAVSPFPLGGNSGRDDWSGEDDSGSWFDD